MIQRGALFLVFIFALLAPVPLAMIERQRANALTLYPEWESEKTNLEMGLNGAWAFVLTPVSLAGGPLNGAINLAAWHGHQELSLKTPWADMPVMEFSIYGEDRAEISIIASDPLGQDRRAIRFSNIPGRQSAGVKLNASRVVLEQKALPFMLLPGRWYNVRLERVDANVNIYVNDKPIGAIAVPVRSTRIAFYGNSSAGRALVDDVKISSAGLEVQESFNGPFPLSRYSLMVLVVGAFLFAIALRLPEVGAALGLSLAAASLTFSWYYSVNTIYKYPAKVDFTGYVTRIETKEQVLQRLSVQPLDPRNRVVLWLGGSQAWGAGASTEKRTAFSLLKRRLDETWLYAFELQNGGIPGGTVADALSILEVVSRSRKVAAVVLTVGVNDSQVPGLVGRLVQLNTVLKTRGAKLFLVPEPVEGEPSEEIRLVQQQVRDFAEKEGLPWHDLQSDFARSADAGAYQWWDFVHLSDGGAAFVADSLYGPLDSFFQQLQGAVKEPSP